MNVIPNKIMESLPSEMIEIILSYLKPGDVYCLSEAFNTTNYYGIYYHNKKVLDLSLDFRITLPIFKSIIQQASTLCEIEHFNINGLYWLQVSEIKKAIEKLKHLKIIYVVNTKFGQHVQTNRFANKSITPYLIKSLYIKIRNDGVQITELILPAGGLKMLQEFSIELLIKCNMSSRIIEDKTWLNNFYQFEGQYVNDLSSLAQQAGMVQLRYEELFVQNVTTLIQERENVKILSIRNINNKKSRIDKDVFNLNFLKGLNFLEKLHIDMIHLIPPTFLSTVFNYCPNLKSIRIYDWNTRYKLTNVNLANENLEDFSYICNDNFQIDKFLMDLNSNPNIKLKRLYLKFNTCSIFSNAPLLKFLTNNPQLIFFGVRCNVSTTVINKIQQTLNSFKVSPQQYFTIFKSDELLYKVPLVHFDMLYMSAEYRYGYIRCFLPTH